MTQDYFREALDRLQSTFSDARQLEPAAPISMTLATCDLAGRPTARTVLLKRVDAEGLVFYSNAHSVKGTQMAENPRACCVFYWFEMQEQLIVEGAVRLLPSAESDSYWSSRPRDSQLAAWVSEQSRPLDERQQLDERMAAAKIKFADSAVPRPIHWLGYQLVPTRIEFWRAGWARLNERVSYSNASGTWTKQLLQP